MATRKELIAAVGSRYRQASRSDKKNILDEFVAITGYHRKHAMRLLQREMEEPRTPRPRRCVRIPRHPGHRSTLMADSIPR
jgi:hypothetical protein